MNEDDEATLETLVTALLDTDTPDKEDEGTRSARADAVDQVMRHLIGCEAAKRWATHLYYLNRISLPKTTTKEDAFSVVIFSMTEFLMRVSPAAAAPSRGWASYLFGVVRSKFSTWVTSAEVTGMSGFSGTFARTRRIQVLTKKLTDELGRTPTHEEVIHANNRHVLAAYKDEATARKAGAMLRPGDFGHAAAIKDPLAMVEEADRDKDTPNAGIVYPLESERGTSAEMNLAAEAYAAARQVESACVETFPGECGLFTVAYALLLQRSVGEAEDAATIAALLGMRQAIVAAHLSRIVSDEWAQIAIATIVDLPVRTAKQSLLSWCQRAYPKELGLVSVARGWMLRHSAGEAVTAEQIAQTTRMTMARVKTHLNQLDRVLNTVRAAV